MNFWNNLKAYRERTGLTAKDFAAQLGISYTTYMGYENAGKEPRIENLAKIAAALHVSIDELVGYEPDRLQYWVDCLKKKGFNVVDNGTTITITHQTRWIFPVEYTYSAFCDMMEEVDKNINDSMNMLRESFFNTKMCERLQHDWYAFKKASKQIRTIAEYDIDEAELDKLIEQARKKIE